MTNRLLLCLSPWAALTSCSCTDGPVLAPLGVRWAGLRHGSELLYCLSPFRDAACNSFHIHLCWRWASRSILQYEQASLSFSCMTIWPVLVFSHSECVGCPPARAASQSTCEEAPPLCHISYLLSNGTWKIAGVGGLRSGWLRAVWVTLHDSCNTHKLELCKG